MAVWARGNPASWWKSRSCGGPSRAPRSLFISPLRRWSTTLILLFLLFLLTGFWFATRPERISRLSEALLSRVLGGNVRVYSGHLSFSGTLLLSGVEVRTADEEQTPASDTPIFTAEQIEARFDWLSLLSGQLSATQLVATTPVFRPIEDRESGHWNYEHLHASSLKGITQRDRANGKSLNLPVVILRDARVKWGEIRQGRVEQTSETVIEGELTPDAALSSTYRFQIGRKDIGAMVRGVWDTANNTFTASTENVVMSDELKNSLPRQAREWCEEHHLAGLLAELKLTFSQGDDLVLSVAFENVSMMFMVQPEQGIAMSEDRTAYSLDVKNVRGRIAFDLTHPGMHVSDLKGQILGYQFVTDCDVQGTSFDAPFTLNLRFPDAVMEDHYPPLFMAFLTSQDLLQRVAPHGKMDIAIAMKRPAARAPLQFDGTIDCHDARMNFAHFPYPMQHLNGRITFDQQSVTFHDVTAQADENDVHISGSAGTTWGTRYIDFTVSSDNAIFDDRMAACLPVKFRPVWDLFSMRGHGGFVCRVTRSNSIFDQPKIVVDVNIDRGSGYLRSMPYPFTDASGRLHFEADETRIDHLTASAGADHSGRLTLDGVVHHHGGDVSRLEPELHLTADIPIDRGLIQALPVELTSKLKDASIEGRLAFNGTVVRPLSETSSDEPVQVAGDVALKGVSFKKRIGTDLLALSGINANVTVSPTQIDLKEFTGDWHLSPEKQQAHDAVAFTIAGKFDTSFVGQLDMTARATGLDLPGSLPGFLPAVWISAWKDYSPSGNADFAAKARVTLNQAPREPGTTLLSGLTVDAYDVAFISKDVTLKNDRWPDPLEKINGAISAVPSNVTMSGMSAVMGNASLNWHGNMKPDGAISLAGEVRTEGLPLKWLDHLPASIRDRLDIKKKDVTLALHLDSLTRPSEKKPWVFEGNLETGNLATVGPLIMDAKHAVLSGKGTFDPALTARGEAMDFSATLTATDMTVNTHLLDTLTAIVEASGKQHLVTLSKLDGKVADGVLQGAIRIHTAEEAVAAASDQKSEPTTMSAIAGQEGYTADLVLNNAELARLLLPPNAGEEERRKVGHGRVDASLMLQETFGKDADRTGRGELTVHDGNMYNVPLSMGLMQIATFRLPVANSFQQATMSYYLRNNEITFERILLESQGINLAGLGTVSISDRALNLSFATESPHELFIPILSPILRETRNGILQLSVTGTVDDPKVNPIPLSAVSNTLRAFLPPQPRARAEAVH